MTRSFFLLFALLAVGCSVSSAHDDDPPSNPPGSSGAMPAPAQNGPVTWCTESFPRTGTVAGQALDYPATPDTIWYNRSLEEIALGFIDEEVMREAGLSPTDKEDVARFKYFAHGFDLRWLLADPPTDDNWFGKSDFGVYLFDVADNKTPPGTAIPVFDASAVREARLAGDKNKLGSVIRATVDAMRADKRPKAIVAFAPNRVPETSAERALINLFARDVHFATTGTVTFSNLRDGKGAPVVPVFYPIKTVRTLDVSVQATMAGTPITANGNCLDLRISG